MRVELLTCSFRGVGPLNTGVKYASRQMKPTWLRQRHDVTSVTRALLVLGLGQTTDSTDHMTPSASSSLEKKCQKKMCICEHDEKMLIHLCHGKEKPHTRWWKHMVEEKNRIMIGCTCYLPSLHACRSIHISQVVNMGSQEKKTEHRNSTSLLSVIQYLRRITGQWKSLNHDPDTGQSDSLFKSTNRTEAKGFIWILMFDNSNRAAER